MIPLAQRERSYLALPRAGFPDSSLAVSSTRLRNHTWPGSDAIRGCQTWQIVIANPAVSTTTGWPVGFWWSELTHPFYVLSEAGYEIEVFSPKGGKCEADAMSDPRHASGYSASDLIRLGFYSTPRLAALVETTRPASEIGANYNTSRLGCGAATRCATGTSSPASRTSRATRPRGSSSPRSAIERSRFRGRPEVATDPAGRRTAVSSHSTPG